MSQNKDNALSPGCEQEIIVEGINKPQRIDTYLGSIFSDFSRSFFQNLIEKKNVVLNGKTIALPSVLVRNSDHIVIKVPSLTARNLDAYHDVLKKLPIRVIRESKDFIILSKPAGLIVHQPRQEHTSLTLVDWLLVSYPEIKNVGQEGRAGIVHRLDKDTSGLMIIARTNHGYNKFVELFKERSIKKIYYALVTGSPSQSGVIDFNIERHPSVPTKMIHRKGSGRESITLFEVETYYKDAALVKASPLTGRTHQIRVHFAAIGHPIVGDTVYGTSSPLIVRQALHAAALSFEFDGKKYEFNAELPEDFKDALRKLK